MGNRKTNRQRVIRHRPCRAEAITGKADSRFNIRQNRYCWLQSVCIWGRRLARQDPLAWRNTCSQSSEAHSMFVGDSHQIVSQRDGLNSPTVAWQ